MMWHPVILVGLKQACLWTTILFPFGLAGLGAFDGLCLVFGLPFAWIF